MQGLQIILKLILILILFAIFDASISLAKSTEEPTTGKILVNFSTQDNNQRWIAKALEQNVYRDISNYQRILSVEKEAIKTTRCKGFDHQCLLDIYFNAGIDIVMLGTLDERELNFKVYESQTKSLVRRGRISLGSSTNLAKIRNKTFRSIKPFIEKGGLLDQKLFLATSRAQLEQINKTETATFFVKHRESIKFLILFITIVFFGLPLFIASRMRSLSNYLPADIAILKGTPQKPRSLSGQWSYNLSAFVIFTFLFIGFWNFSPLFKSILLESIQMTQLYLDIKFSDFKWLLPMFAGMSWGLFLLLSLKFVFASLPGLERVRHWNVFLLTRSWIYMFFLRFACAVIFFLPFAFIVERIGRLFDFPEKYLITLVFPLAGLLVYYWFLSVLEVFSLFLDNGAVDGPPTVENHWHYPIKKYFIGYCKRLGIPINQNLINKICFLPGCSGEHAISYGSGLKNYRIVVDYRFIEFAMGSREENQTLETTTSYHPNHAVGLIVPDNPDIKPPAPEFVNSKFLYRYLDVVAADSKYQDDELPQYRRDRQFNPKPLNIFGIVLPTRSEENIPLISNNLEDFDVVEELLFDHRAEFEKDFDDEELDDTDPTDKDFLFGLLMLELGKLQRRNNYLSTIRYAISLSRFKVPALLQEFTSWVVDLYNGTLARYPTLLADSYTALNYSHHHLIQYLYLCNTSDQSLLTSRANAATLYKHSTEAFNNTADKYSLEGAVGETPISGPTYVDRLIWLSQFFYSPIKEVRGTLFRTILTGGIALLLSMAVIMTLKSSIDYHQVYLNRVAALHPSGETKTIKKEEN